MDKQRFICYLVQDGGHVFYARPCHTQVYMGICKEALFVASNSRLAILHTATELCEEPQSPRCTFAILEATSMGSSRACLLRNK